MDDGGAAVNERPRANGREASEGDGFVACAFESPTRAKQTDGILGFHDIVPLARSPFRLGSGSPSFVASDDGKTRVSSGLVLVTVSAAGF